MSALFVNKVVGASLAAVLGIILINKFSGFLMKPNIIEPENYAYKIGAQEKVETVKEPVPFPSPDFIAAMDAEKGAKVYKKCKSCHTADASKKDGTGPHLWGVVGRPKASIDGFSYSEAMTEKGGVWDYEALNDFLIKPSKYIPKTKMAFNGLKKESDRAAIIEFLRLQSDNPIAPLVAVTQEVEQEVVDPEKPEAEKPVVEKKEGGH